MNALHTDTALHSIAPSAPVSRPATPVASIARREPRERDFGIGYGNSSGYASHRRYASNWGETRFRCA